MASYSEADAIKRIIRHHGADPNSPLARDLERLLDWVVARERSKTALVRGTSPMPLLSLLGSMGIYGAEALNKVGGDSDAGHQTAS